MHTKKTLKDIKIFKKCIFCFYDKHCGPKHETVYFIFKLLCHNPSLKKSDSQLKKVPGDKK